MLEWFKNLSTLKKLGLGILILIFIPYSLFIIAAIWIARKNKHIKIKSLFKYAKRFALGFLFIILGIIFASPFTSHSEESKKLLSEKVQLEEHVHNSSSDLEKSSDELNEIISERDLLILKKDELINKTSLTKAEVDKLNADKLAKEEAEKQQQLIASANKPTNGNISSGNSTAGSSAGNTTSGGNSSSGGGTSSNNNSNTGVVEPIGQLVWKTATGSKYHSINNCGKTNPATATQVTLDNAKAAGLTACSKCY